MRTAIERNFFVRKFIAGQFGRHLTSFSLGLFLAAYASAPAYAFSPFQAPLLSTAAVTPNVMLLLDNSGSMNTLVTHSGYNSSVSYPDGMYCIAGTSCNPSNKDHWANIKSLSGSDDVASGSCGASFYQLGVRNAYKSGKNTYYYPGSAAATVCVPRPDLVRGSSGSDADTVSISSNYQKYLVQSIVSGVVRPEDVPTGHRMSIARNVAKDVIANNITGIRFGIATFRPGTTQVGGESYQRQGGIIRAGLGTDKSGLNSVIDSLYGVTATPLAEAYYDVIRYYRGLQGRHSAAPSKLSDQVQYRCQKNFGVIVTDGAPTYDTLFYDKDNDPLRDNPAVGGGNNLPNWDGKGSGVVAGQYADGPEKTGLDKDGDPIIGQEGNNLYLDDMAAFGFDIDIRPNASMKDNAGKSFNQAPFEKQNIRTYTVGFAIDHQMLSDAATYGRGKYYTAQDTQGLTTALTQAFGEISAQAGSGGAGASSSASLNTATRYYTTLYDPKDWRGTIEAYSLSSVTGRVVNKIWTTNTTITPSNNGASYQGFNTQTNSVISLDYGSFSVDQQAQLSAGLPAGVTGEQLVDWAKGIESPKLRARSVLLGDVINSTLERLSSTEQLASELENETSYTAYLGAKSQLTDSLLVNSNDGFFHVIDAETGGHRYAYMPSSVVSSLNIVAAPTYATSGSHKFMVDGPITVADAQLNGGWASVAVAGMGGGGKSTFAVKLYTSGDNTVGALWEVSPPAQADASNVWNDLGYSYSKPLVARNADNQWVAIFGNGYGSHGGKAALYVVNLETGALIQKIVVDENNTGTPQEIAAGSGLSSPSMVVDAQYRVNKVYAGDIRGNVWEFDFSSSNVSVGNGGVPLYSAGSAEPITVKPLVVEHPQGGHLLLFGAGKLMEQADKLVKTLHSFYAIWDKDGVNGTVQLSSLQAQGFANKLTKLVNGVTETYYTSTSSDVDWSTQRGWYFPLSYNGALDGERVIYPAQETNGRVVFVTAEVDSTDPCSSTGRGKLIELDALTGGALTYPVLDTNGDGKIDSNDDMVSGLAIDDLPGAPVIVGSGEDKKTQTKYILKSTGAILVVDECERGSDGRCGGDTASRRIMWRQLE